MSFCYTVIESQQNFNSNDDDDDDDVHGNET